ncbi:cation transporter [Leptolyngbya sp. 'hensonii']|uniref:cation diffusion facilitator family transporter n=1 Tax=Leptolyngbya sp. 'hensonii' TaxID=1922337 RepID=UPI00094FEFA8|nr:cation diffusion facilitator family transporter [Leptolyngbya sp. 'hensonii']OLP17287.1 cation transporter [Leptolyngbya sp. 'hensonii']
MAHPQDHSHHPPDQSHEHRHGHYGHGHSPLPIGYNRAFIIGLGLNLGFVVVEFVYGILAHSIALIADAGHNLNDAVGLVLAWVAILLSARQPSPRRTYGWRRSSILAALMNSLLLLVVTGGIAWEAVHRFQSAPEVAGGTMIAVATVGIGINGITALMFMADREKDINIRAAFLHMAADALVSLGVVLAGVVILFSGWTWVDPAFSLLISFAIMINTWGLLKESFNLAIDAVPAHIDERAVRTFLAERPGVADVHDLHIWGMSTTEAALTAHLVIPAGHPGDEYLAQICHDLRDHFRIKHTTLQIELTPSSCACHLLSVGDP